VEDLEQARVALGYERINLYGVSYGSRLALTYLKQYPELVRSLILDGIVPQDEVVGLNVSVDAQQTMDLIFESCLASPECAQAYPELPAAFAALLERLEQEPVSLTVAHPVTGKPTTLAYSRDMLAGTVRLMSYLSETISLLPLLIYTAHSQDDFSLLAAQYLLLTDQLENSVSVGLNYSVICSEDAPFMTPEQARQASIGAYSGEAMGAAIFEICATWPHAAAPEGFKEVVVSDTPALLLSGEFDPVTPPRNGERVAQGLSNSVHLVVQGHSHNLIFRGCLPRLAATFLESPSPAGLNTSCVEKIHPSPFFTSFAGPAP
jgi:pimeloyl-ACP methyl ester carboxylesterase